MYISARERKILDILLEQHDELTVKDLADRIDVSARTIHRDLKGVEDIVREYGLSLVKKSGVGIKIEGSEEKVKELHMFLFNASHNEYTPEERQTVILCSLLETNEPVKLIALANELNVTIATISNDLTKLQERLDSFGLTLIRRRGYGVGLSGTESAKRRAMSSLISSHVDEFKFLSMVREAIQKKATPYTDSISEKLLGLVEKRKLLVVEKVLEEINTELPYSIADSAYIGLVIHLALAIERIQQGENINIDQAYLDSLQGTVEYSIAEKVIEKLENVFSIRIPQAEVGYITMHLRGAKLRHDKEYLIEDTSFNIALKAKSLIDFVAEQLNPELSENQSLFQGLVAHLRPAIYRIKQSMGISNPLLEKIRMDYAELFAVVRRGVDRIFSDLDVPDEEIGYLVLHFGSALIGQERTEQIKALIICSTGIGTSKMLATRISQEIPEIKQPRNVSLFELNQLNLDEYDLVLSTVHAPELPEDYILVNPILTHAEIEKIKTRIRTKGSARAKGSVTGSERTQTTQAHAESGRTEQEQRVVGEIIGGIQSIRNYSEAILTILTNFKLIRLENIQTIQQVLEKACEQLQHLGTLTDSQAVSAELRKREQLGGLGIPDTKLALFHTRSEHVKLPSFTIYRLNQPLKVMGMDDAPMEVRQMLLMLSPHEVPKQTLEVLSYISTLIIEDHHSMAIFESEDMERISSYLATRFDRFFNEKIKG